MMYVCAEHAAFSIRPTPYSCKLYVHECVDFESVERGCVCVCVCVTHTHTHTHTYVLNLIHSCNPASKPKF